MNRVCFDHELRRGAVSYDGEIGDWWLRKAANRPHLRAYRRIADYIGDSFPAAPGTILDYACGPGHLLSLLARRFPASSLVGIDGSQRMLQAARTLLSRQGLLAPRIRLQKSLLPDFGLPRRMADVAVYAFPNLLLSPTSGRRAHLGAAELSVARSLALQRDGANDDDPKQVYQLLLEGRLVSLNLSGLLRRGGVLFRVEYAGSPRRQFTRLQLERAGFEEGSMELAGVRRQPWFRLAACRYVRSSVMNDVYDQTGEPRDLFGGYSITVLRAC
jgi:SAM-dependent methyltransferase